MKDGLIGVGLFCVAIAVGLGPARAQQASQAEIDELKRALDQQEETVRALRDRINALEANEAEPAPAAAQVEPAAAPPAAADSSAPPSPIEEAEARMREVRARRARVRYHDNFDDKQEAAARPGDYTLDPDFRGFIPIPNTAFMVKFNPRPRVDMTLDDGNNGSEMRFVPGLIPVENQGSGARFNVNGNGSQLRVDMQAPDLPGNLRFYYQNDFFGSDDKNFSYRLQHFYGQFYGVVAGFTYGVFEDPDAWPDTVDYEGPNSVIFARRPVAQYKTNFFEDWQLTLAVEDPDIFLDTTGDPDASRRTVMPDVGFNVRWLPGDLGHVQFSTIFRTLAIDGGDAVGSDETFAWGTNIAGSLNVTDADTLMFWFVYGEGIGGMGNDTSFHNTDGAFNADGNLVALDYFSSMVAFTHRWTPRWRSTATYGFVNLQNAAMQEATAYDQTHYASVNLIYQLFKRMSIGVEGLYGVNKVKSGDEEDAFRLQLGLFYSLFD